VIVDEVLQLEKTCTFEEKVQDIFISLKYLAVEAVRADLLETARSAINAARLLEDIYLGELAEQDWTGIP
jgi:Zn-finger domain-containing protein